MEKPASLRAEIERHLPELAAHPDKLAMFVTEGRVIAHKATLSHETKFTLSLLITDFSGNIDILHTAVINWLHTHQPDILLPGAVDPRAFVFEAEILNAQTADVLIELKLSERTTALVDESGRIEIAHPGEPQHIGDLCGIIGANM